MWINRLDEYKSEYKFSKWNITFYDTDLNETQLIKIDKYILEKWEYKEFIFWNTNIIDFWSNLLLVEITNLNIENTKKWFTNKFEMDWYFSKELENKRQIPEYKWYFEYKWKIYIMLDWLNKLTDEINPEKWIYKWVIIEPNKYFEVESEVKNVVSKIEDIL